MGQKENLTTTSHHTQNQRPMVGGWVETNDTLKGQHRRISSFDGLGREKELFNYAHITIIIKENN